MQQYERGLDQIEILLSQSTGGIHALFDHRRIAQILSRPTEYLDFFQGANLAKIQDIFAQLASCQTCLERQNFLMKLAEEDYETLVRTYFHILENTVLANSKFRH